MLGCEKEVIAEVLDGKGEMLVRTEPLLSDIIH
jgi:hypothetical protein